MPVLYVNLPADIHAQIVDAAGRDERSISAWVRVHFRDHFAREDAECETGKSRTDSSPSE